MTTPQPGDLIAVHTTMFFSRLIQGAQWLRWRQTGEWKYNHAAVYIGNGRIIEANPAGVQEMPLSEYDPKDYIVVPLKGDAQATIDKAISLKGTGYGWIDIVSIFIYILGFKPAWADKINRRMSTLVCSQVAAIAATAGGDNRFPEPYLTVPAQIAVLGLGPINHDGLRRGDWQDCTTPM